MSTREYVNYVLDGLTEEQLEDVAIFLEEYSSGEDAPNAETAAALAEFEEMKSNPQKYKHYSSFKEIMDEVISDV